MTAPVGATVRIHIDLAARVAVGDVIETASGRGYRVLGVRIQERGKHAGRQHLQCVVLPNEWASDPEEWMKPSSFTIHRIRWYPRAAASGHNSPDARQRR